MVTTLVDSLKIESQKGVRREKISYEKSHTTLSHDYNLMLSNFNPSHQGISLPPESLFLRTHVLDYIIK